MASVRCPPGIVECILTGKALRMVTSSLTPESVRKYGGLPQDRTTLAADERSERRSRGTNVNQRLERGSSPTDHGRSVTVPDHGRYRQRLVIGRRRMGTKPKCLVVACGLGAVFVTGHTAGGPVMNQPRNHDATSTAFRFPSFGDSRLAISTGGSGTVPEAHDQLARSCFSSRLVDVCHPAAYRRYAYLSRQSLCIFGGSPPHLLNAFGVSDGPSLSAFSGSGCTSRSAHRRRRRSDDAAHQAPCFAVP